MRTKTRRSRRSRLLRLILPALALGTLASACGPAVTSAPFKDADNGTPTDHGWFEGGKVWTGSFPDPTVLRVGNVYYAYSTTAAGRYLPVLTSTDLKTWTIHRRWSAAGPPNTRGYDVTKDPAIPAEIRNDGETPWTKYDNNDALVRVPSWAMTHNQSTWLTKDYWAPGVVQIGSTYFAYSAVKVSNVSDNSFGRFCLTVATSSSPLGPFRDTSTGPVQCQSVADDPGGSIDPAPYTDPATGRHFLTWKAQGKVGVHESQLLARELGNDGKLKPNTPTVKLLSTSRTYGWEGTTIENPSMVTYHGTTYLFYSANSFGVTDSQGHSNYAEGYAICPKGPFAACTRPTPQTPLLKSNGTEQGPGGGSAFLDTSGGLQLAYHAYWLGENRNGAHTRRLHVTHLTQNADKTLRVG